MKILWIFPEFPYPLTSGLLRGFHLVRLLSHSHAITFLSLTDDDNISPERIRALEPYAERIEIFSKRFSTPPRWIRAFSRTPSLGWRLRESWNTASAVRRMKSRVQALLQRETFDVLVFNGREASPLLESVKIPIVIDCGDTNCARILQQMIQAELLFRPRLLLRYWRERQLEERLARKTPYRCFISTRDRENLLGSRDGSEIVPQGVDDEYWKRQAPPSDTHCIVFSGAMNYPPNEDAALFLLVRVLPLVRLSIPNLQVLIVGRDPSPELLKLSQSHHDVTVTGTVADIRPYLERADVFVAAIRFASGVQNKVLEAMAMEIPVVTTPVVAAGLRFDDLYPRLVIGNTAEEIAAGITHLLRHPEERMALAAAGRQFIESHCSWSRSAEKLENLCLAAVTQSLAQRHETRRPPRGLSRLTVR